MILLFSWRNILRNRRRTVLTLTAAAIGMLSLVFGKAFIAGTIQAMTEPAIRLGSGHIRLAHPEFLRLERTLPKEHRIAPLSDVLTAIDTLPDIVSRHPMLKFRALAVAGRKNQGAIVTGIDAEADHDDIRLSDFIVKGTFLTHSPDSLVIGKRLAEELEVDIGSELLLVASDINFSTYALPFTVSGIIHIGVSGIDRNGLLIHMKKASELLDCPDSAHEILLFCSDPERAGQLSDTLKQRLLSVKGLNAEVIPWQDNELMRETLPLISTIWGSILIILMFLVVLVILNTMLMSVMERYHEIGILKALGLKNRDVAAMIFCEAGILGGIGSVIGGFLGTILTLILSVSGIELGGAMNSEIMNQIDVPLSFIGSTLYPLLTPAMIVSSLFLGLAAALTAVLYPAMKSVSMTPADAFRTELKV